MQPYSLDLRLRIVDAYEAEEGSIRELGDRFKVHFRTVQRYLNLVRTTGSVSPRPHGGGVPARIDAQGLQIVRSLVEEGNDRTAEELTEEFKKRAGMNISRSSINRALKRLHITRKKKTLRATEQERPDVQRQRRSFLRRARGSGARHLIFVDEFGTHLGMTRRYGRARRGQRACGHAPCNSDPNLTLVFGLGLRGVVAPFAFPKGMNGTVFDAYVQRQLRPKLRRGDVVVVDGLGAHRTLAARRAIRSRGATLWFLPPYSPDLSPVENCGSKVKEAIRAEAPRSVPWVYGAMGRALEKVTPEDARGWFRHAGYLPRKARKARSSPAKRHLCQQQCAVPPGVSLRRARESNGLNERAPPEL